ncbi:MAG: M48 family metallopeptidase [Bacteroidetes bacterium]|nr:M48 family metallopeptidase [Bacteroidota bacterium]
MKRFFVSFLFIFFAVWNSYSQSLNLDYTVLKSVKELPASEFEFSLKEKVQRSLLQVDKSEINNQKDRELYSYVSNFALNELLKSGCVVYGDTISVFVNRVADELLKDDLKLRKELHFFVAKLPDVNAYCMSNGYIFVNIGLIAHLKNEAQLAFVLSHEISHYVKKHNINTFKEHKRIDSEYKKKTFDDRFLEKIAFSKENESEADLYGLELFKKSKYSKGEIIPTFDVLKYSYLPIENILFDSTFFNDKYYKIPQRYFLSSVLPISDNENYDDSRSTHPNIRNRKENIEDSLFLLDDQGSKFLISESHFDYVRDVCRFELCRVFLIERSYLNSLYTAYVLKQKYPNNIFLEKIIVKSLYAMTLYKNGELKYGEDSYRKAPIPDFTKTEGCSQQLNFMLDRIPQKEISVLTLKYAWKNHLKYKDEPLFSSLSDSLMFRLTTQFRLTNNDFVKNSDQLVTINKDNYFLTAFWDYMNTDPEFCNKFSNYSKGISKGATATAMKPFVLPDKKKSKTEEKSKDVEKITIDKIVVIDPYYKRIDETVSDVGIYSINEKRKSDFLDIIEMNARKIKIDCEIIDPNKFLSSNTVKYDDFSVFNDWFNERMEGGRVQSCPILNTDEITLLVKKYGTKYFLWNGVFSVKLKSTKTSPAFDLTYYYAVLFDIETGAIIFDKDIKSYKPDLGLKVSDYVDDAFDCIVNLRK